jgi:hypothetical protein
VEKVSVRVKVAPVELARMLGKIAYGFAVAAFGLGAVRGSPLVQSFMQEPNTIGILVGSADAILARAPTLHQVELEPQDWGVLVQVRLIAQFGSRPYLVAVPGSPSTVSPELSS